MVNVYYGKRAFAALFLIFFTACSKPCQQWALEKIQTHYPCYNSARVYWETTNRFNGIDLEVLFTAHGTSLFLNIYTFQFPHADDPQKSEVVVQTNDRDYRFLADRLVGGQRLLLSPENGSLILDLLTSSISFTIKVDGYSETILPTNFSRVFPEAVTFL